MKNFIIIVLISFTANNLYSQDDNFIQFSGITKNFDAEILPYTHIVIKNTKRGFVADNKGMFTIIVEPFDTVFFSTVGYKKYAFIIPSNLETYSFTRDIYLEKDTLMLGEVKIYPWRTYEEFKKAFLTTDITDLDMDNAQRNIELIKVQLENSIMGDQTART